ncbi:indole-3-glycerol phosphate synthase TrpC [Euzebya tangerina]|uniref:indole-3-glycerol phosphate synthase TrpC n=1 Tax=Euzebya tangerina TaxID=591198 RepID=UPI000E31F651|nr:indole-3-glycerol phosphate synthase TrpC [Euzebya tangerina]
MRSGFLQQVCAEASQRVAADEAEVPLAEMIHQAQATAPPPSFAAALADPRAGQVAAITEVKRASPSRGHMADIPDPAALARSYADGGASAISVLTEPAHFSGGLTDLEAVADAVDLPVIRKDFIVVEYQVWQARSAGAAAVLLIVAALEDTQMGQLMRVADRAGLDCLVETHSAEEVARGVAAHATADTGRRLILGVNARDLVTLEVDRGHVARVREEADLPDGALLVAESGIRGRADVAEYEALGADAILVGEHVATAADPTAAVRALLG